MVKFLLIANALFFVFYGIQCFTSRYMKDEFRRFGLPDSQRILTGVLQLLGAAGLIVGLYVSVLGVISAMGLALMMLVAFGVRMRIKDSFAESAPSLIFMVLNGYLAFEFFKMM
jgi:hypothetical protein